MSAARWVRVEQMAVNRARLMYTSACMTAPSVEAKGKNIIDKIPLCEVAPPKPFSEMPGPVGLPLVGTLWDYMRHDGYSFRKLFKVFQERAHQFGPVYQEKIAQRLSVVVSDPVEYAKVVRADGKYPRRMEMEPMVHYRNKRGLCLGTVNSQGAEWHRHRKVVSKKTLRPLEVLNFCAAMSEVTAEFVDHMVTVIDEDGTIPGIEFEVFKWALECTFIFEERVGCLDNPPSERGQKFLRHLMGFFKKMQLLMYDVPVYKVYPNATWRAYEKHADVVHQLALEFVQKRMIALKSGDAYSGNDCRGHSEDGTSFLTYLLEQTQLPPNEANSHAVDLMIGGVETTSTALVWTLYCLARAPEIQKKVHEEIKAVLPGHCNVTPEVLSKIPYIKACLRETFRIFPITFSTSRILQEDLEVGGYVVPSGTHIQANLYGMGHDPEIFPEPELYQPERWLRTKAQMTPSEQAIYVFANLPWGHGPRMCLGRRLAEQEIYIALLHILRTFEVQHHGEPIEPVLNTVMTPDRPVKFTFVKREM